jgi:hypothetical protein
MKTKTKFEPTPEQWIHYFKVLAQEWFDNTLTKYNITVDDSIQPFCRAIAYSAWIAGFDENAKNLTEICNKRACSELLAKVERAQSVHLEKTASLKPKVN